MAYDSLRRGFAEFVGTFTLVFVGAGSILAISKLLAPALGQGGQTASVYSAFGLLGVAVAHGLAIAVMVSAVGHISGGHFNPAVTFGFLVTRRIDPMLAVVYWVAQFGGAVIAALLLDWIFPSNAVDATKLGSPLLNAGIGSGAGVAVEIILTFFLVWVIFATAVDPRGTFKSIAGLAIGLTITIDILFGGPLTGAAMNPSRAFGPQLVGNNWANGWVWYVGPALGGIVA